MKAVAINGYGGPERLVLMDLPKPEPVAGEILVRVYSAGVNPVDTKIRMGLLKNRIPNQFPLIPGWDAAGVVESVGPGVHRFKPGDEVYAYCRKPIIQHGTYAEYIALAESVVALKPVNLSFEESAAIPLAGLTAWQSLFDVAGLRAGQTVLVHAASGGVGGFAVQLARDRGAKVIATCSAGNADHVKKLGADHVIDYTAQDFREGVRHAVPGGVDVAFDTVGGDVQTRSADCVRPGGILVAILAFTNEEDIKVKGVIPRYHFVAPNAAQLEELAEMAEGERLKVHLAAVLPLEQAAKAHELIETRRTVGKIVLRVRPAILPS